MFEAWDELMKPLEGWFRFERRIKFFLRYYLPLLFFAYVYFRCCFGTPDLVRLTDYPAALVQASKQNKLVAVYFSRSDWSTTCKLFNGSVLHDSKFRRYAADHLVFVQIDFPRDRFMAPEQLSANQALAEKFSVTNFPTVMLFDGQGAVLMREESYDARGAVLWLDKFKRF